MGQGGLALPNLYKYFLVGQMVFTRPWLLRDEGDAATVLEAAIFGSYEGLANLIHRGSKVQSLTGSMKVTIRAWDRVQDLMAPGIKFISLSTPLWFNHKLQHFSSIPDPVIWTGDGIKRLQDVVEEGRVMYF